MSVPSIKGQVEFKQHLQELEAGLADPKKWIATDNQGRVYVKKKWSKFVRFLLCFFDKISGGRIFRNVHADRVGKNLLVFCSANCKHINQDNADDEIKQIILRIFDSLRDKTRNKKYQRSIDKSKGKLSKIHNFCVICCDSTALPAPSEYVKKGNRHPHDERVLACCNNIFHNACLDENLKINNTCPICRVVLQPPDPSQGYRPPEMTRTEIMEVAGISDGDIQRLSPTTALSAMSSLSQNGWDPSHLTPTELQLLRGIITDLEIYRSQFG